LFTHRATVFAAIFLTLTNACAPEGVAGEDDAESAESAASTTELVAMGPIAKGASKTGIYTATVAGQLTFRTAGTGDIDLYVRKGAAPTTTLYDAKSEGPTSAEELKITVAKGDQIRFLLYGYSAGTANLVVVVPDAAPATTVVTLVPSGFIAAGASKTGSYTSTVTGRLTFRSRGTGDADLYLKKNATASRTSYDAKGEGSTATEDVSIDVVVGDKVFYLLYGYSASTASLDVLVPGGTTSNTTTLSLPTLPDDGTFRAFSTPGGGLSTSGRSMKFLIDNRTPTARTINS